LTGLPATVPSEIAAEPFKDSDWACLKLGKLMIFPERSAELTPGTPTATTEAATQDARVARTVRRDANIMVGLRSESSADHS
jgi:hypothetical protein